MFHNLTFDDFLSSKYNFFYEQVLKEMEDDINEY